MDITGQFPVITKVKKSIAAFNIRKNMNIGLKIDLSYLKMYSFLERLIFLILPKIRDFRGFTIKNFDNNGNFSFGINNVLLFPEIESKYNKIFKKFGLNITIVMQKPDKENNIYFLKKIGFPINF